MISPRTPRLSLLFPFLALGLGAGFAPSREWAPKEFPISFWCGPPDPYITIERYKEVAAAGFNFLMPPCEGPSTAERNHRILDAAKATGLKAFLQDDRIPLSISGTPDAKQKLNAVVADFAKHPALAGYFIMDEPGAQRFAGLAEVVAYLREKDPNHPAYINLYPNYVSLKDLGADTYADHVRQFIETVHPFALSYDHYHFLKSSDRPGFFANLDLIRAQAENAGIPFWQIVLATQHGDYRTPNGAEKRWEAMQTLAFGGKGVLYFTYWQPGDKSFEWGNALVNHNGALMPQYEEVRKINADVRAIGKYLLDAVPVATFMNGSPAPEVIPRLDGIPVSFPDKGDVTAGLFRADTHLYVLFANRDYRTAAKTDVLLATAKSKPQQLNKATGRWLELHGTMTPEGDLKIRLDLAPGDAELYRW